MKNWQKMVDTRDYPLTRGTLEHYALQSQQHTRSRSSAWRRQRAIEAARGATVAAVLCVALAAVVLIAGWPWWAFVGVAALIWIGAFAEWSK